MSDISDTELLNQLNSSSEQKSNAALKHIYGKYFPVIRTYVLSNSGKAADAKDIFQDSIAALYLHVRKESSESVQSIKGYLMTVSKNLWLKKIRAAKVRTDHREKVEIHQSAEVPDPLKLFVNQEQTDLLKNIVRMLGEECQKVLMLFYYEKYKMKKIAQAMNFADEQAAKNKKYKCLKKLKEKILNNSTIIDFLRK